MSKKHWRELPIGKCLSESFAGEWGLNLIRLMLVSCAPQTSITKVRSICLAARLGEFPQKNWQINDCRLAIFCWRDLEVALNNRLAELLFFRVSKGNAIFFVLISSKL